MNKTKIILTASALLLAISGAFASRVTQVVYQKLNASGTNCQIIQECFEPGIAPCLYSVTGEKLFLLDIESKCLVEATRIP